MEVKGKITHILDAVTGTSAKGEWTKQTFVIIEDKDQYPKSIAIDVFNEKVNIPPVGTLVNAFINIDSREFNGKWYTNIGVWKMDIVGDYDNSNYNPNATGGNGNEIPNNGQRNPPVPIEGDDDLPF